VINGETFRYTVKGDIINLSKDAASIQIPYQLDGETLITSYNGLRTVYVRDSDSARTDAGGGTPAELAGKWCYMSNVNANNGGRMSNRCITLYANGTFEYYAETSSSGQNGSTASQDSDTGTWSATATSITAKSRRHGVLTYSLQKRNPKTGDAMIVLDGEALSQRNKDHPGERSIELTLRRLVTFSSAYFILPGHAANFHLDAAKLSVTVFVCRIVTQAVLRADVIGDVRKRRARIL
jgi:hypothetical protein